MKPCMRQFLTRLSGTLAWAENFGARLAALLLAETPSRSNGSYFANSEPVATTVATNPVREISTKL